MSGAALLAVRGLAVRYGGVAALDGVDFAVARGERRALIGPNGAGKSTLFRCLTGQAVASAGRVMLAGRDVTGFATHRLARLGIGLKTQVPSLFDGLTVIENLAVAAQRRHAGRALARAVADGLERFAIGHLGARPAGSLGHGERQIVELACVLAVEPSLVLLDEPAAGMSAPEIDRLVALIGTIEGDRAVIVVEHDMDLVGRLGGTVTVLDRGRVLAEGSYAAVMADPRVRAVYLGRGGADA